MKTAKISEIFESIQGEGVYLGERQVFVRFFGCDLRCRFCDTPQSDYREYSREKLLDEISGFRGYHSLSLTGGEPLLQVDFLIEFLKDVRRRRVRSYLETNGVHPEALARIIRDIDIVAMDLKLPSSTGMRAFWKEHAEFLRIALTKEVFIKMVITKQTTGRDILSAASVIGLNNASVPVVLQPNWFDVGEDLSSKMETFKKELLCAGIRDVRILPQAHKLVGIK